MMAENTYYNAAEQRVLRFVTFFNLADKSERGDMVKMLATQIADLLSDRADLLSDRADLLAACEAYIACEQLNNLDAYMHARPAVDAQIRAAFAKARGEKA